MHAKVRSLDQLLRRLDDEYSSLGKLGAGAKYYSSIFIV